MSLAVEFSGAQIHLFGHNLLQLNGAVRCEFGNLTIIIGQNGSGKTILLSTMSSYYGYPFGPIRYIERNKIKSTSSRLIRRVAIVRQEPLSNYVGGVLSDEFRIAYSDSQYDAETFQKELLKLLRTQFDIDINLLSRHPKTMSSGEQQIISVGLAVLADADMVLLDEPLARLSRRNASKILDLLENYNSSRYMLMTTPPSKETHLNPKLSSTHLQSISKNEHKIEIIDGTQGNLPSQSIDVTITDEILSTLFINKSSYETEKKWSQNFKELPENNVRCIHGIGDALTTEPIDVKICTKDRVLTSAGDLTLHAGINLVYGDNGAGKTLIARFLAGEFPTNPLFPQMRSIYASGTVPQADTAKIVDMPSRTNMRWLRKKVHSFYLPAEPESFLAETTVQDEVESIYGKEGTEQRLRLLQQIGIDPNSDRMNLSYGQQKILSFITLPEKLFLTILDEPFANLSTSIQAVLANLLLKRIQAGTWHTVVITTNRPIDTILSLVSESQMIPISDIK